MADHKEIPAICIVGRPNVGKSSLFNWLLGERRAVVVEESGTTRDRVEAVIKIHKHSFKLVDTGGYITTEEDKIYQMVKDQIYKAIEEAAVIVMVVDAAQGITALDRDVSDLLRKLSRQAILVVNKCDNKTLEQSSVEFFKLGFGAPTFVSCLHRKGMDELQAAIMKATPELSGAREEDNKRIKIAIVGRPNVGKSSFVNYLMKEQRVIVSDIPGTTRDSIDTLFSYDGDDYILIDTAGIRHNRKIKTVVDTFSIMRSRESIKRSDITFFLLDAAEGITTDDMEILDFIYENGKACLVVINKWDLSCEAESEVKAEDYEKELIRTCARLRNYPMLFVSAKTGKNVSKSLPMAKVLDANLDFKATTPFLNKIFKRNDPAGVPIPRNKKRPNFLYITQSCRRPVEFSFFVSNTEHVIPAHLSYIENVLRDNLPLKGIPIKIKVKSSRKEEK